MLIPSLFSPLFAVQIYKTLINLVNYFFAFFLGLGFGLPFTLALMIAWNNAEAFSGLFVVGFDIKQK